MERWTSQEGCDAPQTLWGPDIDTLFPDRQCGCEPSCDANPVPGAAGTVAGAAACFVGAPYTQQVEFQPGFFFNTGYWSESCFARPCFANATHLRECLNPCRTPERPKAIWLVGDSHAASWLRGAACFISATRRPLRLVL